jgi:hypothetical protein
LHQALGNSLQGLWFQENPRVNVRYEQNAQRREALGPCRWGELRFNETKSAIKDPAVRTPDMAEKGIDEAGKKYIRVTLGELDYTAVRIYSAPLVTADVARRRQLISFEY